MVIKILIRHERRIFEFSKNFNKKIENIKNNQPELMNTITEMKNILERINRLEDAEEWLTIWKPG